MPFNQPFGQQEPGMFPAIDQLREHVHDVVPYMLGGCGVVGGYFFGISQDTVPVALCVGLGLVVGLLLVPLVLRTFSFLVCLALVVAAALAMFWLLNNDAALKHHRRLDPAPQQQIQSANNGFYTF